MTVNKGVVVNGFLQTSDPNVFAAGDVAEFLDETTQQYQTIELWGPAGTMGKIAGINITGQFQTFHLGTMHSYTTFFGLACHVLGVFNPSDPENYTILVRDDVGPMGLRYVKLILQDAKLWGQFY